MRHNINRKKSDFKMTLQQKTLLLLIILLLFFCMMFMVATSIISKRTDEDFMMRTSETSVNNVVSTIKATLVNYNYLTRLIMINDNVVTFLKAEETNKNMEYEARSSISEIHYLYSNVDSVFIFRNDRKYLASTGGAKYYIDENSAERKNVLDARGSSIVSINANGMIKREDGKQLLTVSRAIYDINSQNLIGMLFMNITCNVFDSALTLQNTSGMCILDTNGTILAGNDSIGDLYNVDYDSSSMVFKDVVLEGEKKIMAGKLAIEPLVVLCVSANGSRTLPRDTLIAMVIILVTFILSVMFCAGFITINLARPIGNLSAAMQRTKSSGWLEKIDERMPNNEIGQLAESYNSMIEYLNALFNRLLEDEKNVQKAEMRVLHEQIKPHFLYNTLETISYMAVQENASKVHDALETLGNFYRNFLSKGNREISLKRELRITQEYLALQKLRYGDIFEDEYIIDDATLNIMVPKLILQPLVENSIYHGVRLKGEKCVIRITTHVDENGLHIIVYDSGIGMSADKIRSIIEPNEEEKGLLLSFGLRGTINRIRYSCDYDNVIQIRSEPGEYTEIEIYIPNMRETKAEEEGE